jgi:hypothetical protein
MARTKPLQRDYPKLQNWSKCCGVCAFRKDQGQLPGLSRVEDPVYSDVPGYSAEAFVRLHYTRPFFCVHQIAPHSNDSHRVIKETDLKDRQFVCAAYAAFYNRLYGAD